ncbi:hypothetical protein KBD49_09300 [Myxococcota bacterium]|nr:hypothetical protein [Myxococcota bacterium]
MSLRTMGLLVATFLPFGAWAVPAGDGGDSPYEVQVLVDGRPVPEYRYQGEWFVEGRKDARYAIRLINRTSRRVEVVVSVDGLDVLDGRPGDYRTKRGYVLGPWQTYDLEGFRLDMGRVAAFRFSTVDRSYAARTGDARNVGVIGVAFFPERRPMPMPRRPIEVPRGGVEEREGSGGASRDQRTRTADATQWGWGRGGGGLDADSEAGSFGGRAEAAPPSAAPSAATKSAEMTRQQARPGLGTEFGEARASAVVETRFVREDARNPHRVVAIRYNDRDGLRAMGVPVDGLDVHDAWLRRTADPFPATRPARPFARPPAGWRP